MKIEVNVLFILLVVVLKLLLSELAKIYRAQKKFFQINQYQSLDPFSAYNYLPYQSLSVRVKRKYPTLEYQTIMA